MSVPLRKLAPGAFSRSRPTCGMLAAANLANASGSIRVFSTPEYHALHGECPGCREVDRKSGLRRSGKPKKKKVSDE